MRFSLFTAVAVAAASSSAFGAWTINSGNAVMTASGNGASTWSNSSLNTVNLLPNGTTNPDEMFYYNWGYRITTGANQNTGMSVLSPGFSQTVAGDTATFNMPDNGPGPVGQNRFDSTLTVKLTDGTSPGAVRVDGTLVITSRTSNTGPFSIELYHAVDNDLNGTFGGDNYIYNPVSGTGTITDAAAPSLLGSFGGSPVANRYQVGGQVPIRAIINGSSAANLTNTATFGPDDGGYALQWSYRLLPGESVTVSSFYQTVVPEPTTIAALGAVGAMALRRRK
jgi:hypothetical protein